MFNLSRTTVQFGVGLLGLAISSFVNAANYRFTALDTLNTNEFSVAQAINNAGQIVGSSGNRSTAVLWENGAITRLSPEDGLYSHAYAINDAGQIAGAKQTSAIDPTGQGGQVRGIIWSGGNATLLDALDGSGLSWANGISPNGIAVGFSEVNGAFPPPVRAVSWEGGSPQLLAILDTTLSNANAINGSGVIAGFVELQDKELRAATWNAGQQTLLGTLNGHGNLANDINNLGQVVGQSFDPEGRALLWNGQQAQALGRLGTETADSALAINNLGHAVGYAFYDSDNPGSRAVLWEGVNAFDLNDFLDEDSVMAGWVLIHANDINDHGWIVGNAHNTITGESRAFLLTPVPEPEIWVLLIAGLGLVGVAARRRQR